MSKQNDKKGLLDDILDDSPLVSMISEEDKFLEPLIEELNLINDEGLKSFVRSILMRAEIFWEIPASFSGKYHPPDERSEGGNVLHTKRVVRAAKILCESHGVSPEEFDLIIAACLLHDVTKGKKQSDGTNAYDKMHPYTVVDLVKKCQEEDKKYASEAQSSTLFLNEEDVQTILRLVRCHMGPWSPVPETVPITYLDMIVHTADNIACKLHYIVDGEEVNEQRWKLN